MFNSQSVRYFNSYYRFFLVAKYEFLLFLALEILYLKI